MSRKHCPRKRRWPTYEQAYQALQRAWAAPDVRIRPTTAYQCVWCGGYHLTSSTTRTYQPRRNGNRRR